jgi:hypothetical protein
MTTKFAGYKGVSNTIKTRFGSHVSTKTGLMHKYCKVCETVQLQGCKTVNFTKGSPESGPVKLPSVVIPPHPLRHL